GCRHQRGPRRRLPRLPPDRRDQLRARQPLPRSLPPRGHVPPHRPRALRMNALPDAIADVAGGLRPAHVQARADAYRTAGAFTPRAAAKAKQAVPAPHQPDVDRLNQAWGSEPDLAGASIALALEAARSAQHRTDLPTVEV